VAGAIADGDVAALRIGEHVLLVVRVRVAEVLHVPLTRAASSTSGRAENQFPVSFQRAMLVGWRGQMAPLKLNSFAGGAFVEKAA
jgi:hypothetical protein